MTIDRRSLIKTGAAAGVAGAAGLLDFAKAWAQTAPFKPEPGAQINMLRWKRFVEAEDAQFMKIIDAFSKATGVKVNISNEFFDDIQPKAASRPIRGRGRTSSGACTRCRTCSRTSARMCPMWPTTSARSMAAGCRPARPPASVRASGSPSPSR